MFKYIWMVIQDLFVTVTLVTLIHSMIRTRYGKAGLSIHWCGITVGVISSIVLAVVKNTTNKIVSSRWNHKIYIGILVFTLAFLVLSLLFGRRKQGEGDAGTDGRMTGPGSILTCLFGAGLSAVWIFYSLPGCIAYPFTFNTMGNGYWSWYFFSRLTGWALAYLILAVYALLLDRSASRIRNKTLPYAALLIIAVSNAFYCMCRFFVPWVNRAKWLNWPIAYDRNTHGWAAALVKFSTGYAMLFIWITAALVLVLIVAFFAENTHVTDPYDNPAQLRKLRAGNRSRRRQAAGLLICLVLSAVSMSVVKAYDTREVVLSEPETYTVEENRILVPMDTVSDGHLHRFEYRTQNDINVRWIVVKKPGSASFGVGLDACEVCGNAGYYENNGRVICKRCDVVMNINTIGFKGGCNPIPLAYEVDGGNLVFAISDLEAGEREFK